MPLISVIIPAYNSEQYIAAAIRSTLAQASDLEVIVVDDHSTDRTLESAEAVSPGNRHVRVLQRETNSGGPAVPRNDAISAATGRYIAFLDSDDEWHAGKLEKQISILESSQAALSCTGYNAIIRGKDYVFSPVCDISLNLMLRMNQVGLSTVVYDRERMADIHFESVGHEDYVAWLTLLRDGVTFLGIPEVLSNYTVRPGSASSSARKNMGYLTNAYRTVLNESPAKSFLRASEYAALSRLRYSNRGRQAIARTFGK